EPIFRQAFEACDFVADFVVEYLRSAAGDRIQTRVPKPRDRVADAQFAIFRNCDNFRSRVAVQVDSGETLFDTTQHLFMPVDLQVGMQAALHQHSRAAHFDSLTNLLVDGFKIEDVSFFGFRAFQRTIEGTEGAVFGAEVGVIKVAINDVSGYAFGVERAAQRVRFHADADQVVGTKQVE